MFQKSKERVNRKLDRETNTPIIKEKFTNLTNETKSANYVYEKNKIQEDILV